MKKILQILLILQILAQTMSCVGAKPASAQRIWNGSADTKWYNDSQNEFTITTPEQLAGLAKLVNEGNDFLGKTVKLGANIMLNDTANWQNWASKPPKNKWKPIGINKYKYYGHIGHLIIANDIYNPFRGTFDGNDFVVSGVYVKQDSYAGLFGYASPVLVQGGAIKNLGVTASYIKGSSYVGGLVGYNNHGMIINCYSTAWVVGGYHAGGLVGESGFGKITDSYSTGNVTGEKGSLRIGGLVGSNSGIISRSYSTGNVAGEESVGGLAGGNSVGIISNSYSTGSVIGKEKVGGLVGYAHGTISSSYSSGKVAGENNVGGLAGKIGSEGRVISSYYDMETSGQSDKGKGEGRTTIEMKQKFTFANWGFDFNWGMDSKINGGYPHLHGIRDEFIITTAEQMVAFAYMVNAGIDFSNKTARLGSNIMLNDTANWHDWANNPPANKWVPIAERIAWKGTFDGGGFAVSGIYINNSYNYQGLFGIIEGTVKNLGVTASYVKGGISIGGLAGKNERGAISNSYSTALVIGEERVGVLVGSSDGAINNSYSIGNAIGKSNVGGLVGTCLGGKTINSYSASVVNGDRRSGGLVGYNREESIISGSHYDREISGQSDEGKGDGKTAAEMKEKSTYEGWDFDTVWGISGEVNRGYPYLLNYNKSLP